VRVKCHISDREVGKVQRIDPRKKNKEEQFRLLKFKGSERRIMCLYSPVKQVNTDQAYLLDEVIDASDFKVFEAGLRKTVRIIARFVSLSIVERDSAVCHGQIIG
jgi:hypothetical protein